MANLLTPLYMQPVQLAGSVNTSLGLWRVSSETEGKVLKRIRVYRFARSIPAIEVWLTGDSNPHVCGTPGRAESSTFEFGEGERITTLVLQDAQNIPTHVGRIRFQTSLLRTFEYGMSVQPTGKVTTVNVGSGVCVGVRASHSSTYGISVFGFMFLRSIQSVRLHGLVYPTISSTSTITTTILQELPATIKNDNDHEPLHWVLAGSRQCITSSTWRTQPADREGLVSHLVGRAISINIDLGIDTPKIVATGGTAGASTNFGWETARTFPSTSAVEGSIADLTVRTNEYSVWGHVSDTLAPAQSLISRRAVLIGEGSIDNLQCSARIQVFTDADGGLPFATFTFPVGVLYSARAHSDVQVLS